MENKLRWSILAILVGVAFFRVEVKAQVDNDNSFETLSEELNIESDIQSERIEQLQEDLSQYQDQDKSSLQSDNRLANPFGFQISVSNLIFWGLEGEYTINNWLSAGASYHSLSFIKTFVKQEQEIKQTIEISNLGLTDVEVTSNIDGDFDYQTLYLRAYPFSSSGFFVQIGMMQRNWSIPITFKTSDTSLHAALPEVLGRITVKTPKSATDTRVGWNWVSKNGFSGSIGIGLTVSGEVIVETDSLAKAEIAGSTINILSDSEIEAMTKEIKDQLKFTKSIPALIFSYGKNF